MSTMRRYRKGSEGEWLVAVGVSGSFRCAVRSPAVEDAKRCDAMRRFDSSVCVCVGVCALSSVHADADNDVDEM